MAGSSSDELHQALIRDHFRRPRNRGQLGDSASTGRAHNRFCGDTVRIWVRIADGRLDEVTFDGRGCAISQAAASMLTAVVRGKEAGAIPGLRQAFVEGLEPGAPNPPRELGDLRALVGVGRFPSRIRCAVLPFDALEEAMREESARGPATRCSSGP